MIDKLSTQDADFWSKLDTVLSWETASSADVEQTVKDIIANVRESGDKALVKYTNKLDAMDVSLANELEIPQSKLEAALDKITPEQKQALIEATRRVEAYHLKQKQESWQYTEDDGTVLGQQITALDKVGLYVPGGKAAYPSSVIMNAIPAKVAGVSELIMVVPTPGGQINDLVLAAAAIVGVDKVYSIGGAQAIAALAFGTKTIPQVDKIVGPGNIYVATAKAQVFGTVGIDMIAGPSEILIICDGKTNPDWIAMDLFSQAEHDEDAQSILISDDTDFIGQVEQSIKNLLPTMEREKIIKTALVSRGAIIQVDNLQEATQVANYIAPEHLELSVAKPEELLSSIKHAGAIFMGRYTAEAVGDYCAGPNHVLPTSRTARFSSPLGVYDFQKRSSIIYCSEEGAAKLAKTASVLARGEGLTAHARSAEYRQKKS